MHSLTYHSGFSLNVTSLGKPLTSETRLGPRGRLSEALHSSLFTQNSLDWIPACSASAQLLPKQESQLSFLTPLPWSLMHGDCSVLPWRCVTCGPHREKRAKSQPSELRASLAKSNNQQTKAKTLGSGKLGGPFTSCSMLSEKNRGKVFQGGRSCKDSQLQNHHTTINQDETVGHWALTVACG